MGSSYSNTNRSTSPPISSCPNDQTCKNFDFNLGDFVCPNARCGPDGCNCGPNCSNLRGTCCRSVVYDEGRREWKCEEGTPIITHAPTGPYSNPELDNLKNEIYIIQNDNSLTRMEKTLRIEELSREIRRIEDSERNTLAPLVYDPYDFDQTYHPLIDTPTMPTLRPSFMENCTVSDKTYQGVVIPGSVICNWFEQA